MSNHIIKLDESTANKIAAGEVVDRPASVVKELIENSIDAKSENIVIEIKDGGKTYIRVTDDGLGISPDDVEFAFERHATSKIKEINDLDTILTLGFRGEALASIASVSKIEVITKHESSPVGIQTKIHGGRFLEKKEVGSPRGTTVLVEELFYNTPARLEFMKSNQSESAAISDMVSKLALSHPNVSFQFINNGTIIFTTPGGGKLVNSIVNIFGRDLAKNLIQIKGATNYFSLEGYVSKPSYTRGNRQLQIFYINGRYVKSKTLNDALSEVYKSLIPSNRFPVAFFYIKIPPDYLDINIHPTKMEVRIKQDGLVKNKLISIIKKQLFQTNLVPNLYREEEKRKPSFLQTTIRDFPLNSSKESLESKQEQLVLEDKVDVPPLKPPSEIEPQVEKDHIPETNSNPIEEYRYSSPKTTDMALDFLNMNLIGSTFQTYLLGEYKNTLYIIDQHAAHERVIFEELLTRYKNSSIVSQKLISPIVIEISHTQFEKSKKYINEFNSLGFEVEEFGTNSYLLRAVPMIWGKPRDKELFMDIIDHLDMDMTKNSSIIERIITQSCKSAIKAMDKLSILEMKELLKKLSKLHNPYTCPHGRPTVIKLTKKEIEKRFMRT